MASIKQRKVGDVLAKDGWTSCAVAVLDVGQIYFVGRLFDYKERIWLGEVIGRLDDTEWIRVYVVEPALVLSTVN